MKPFEILQNYFLSSCPEGVIAFDAKKTILLWNPVMEKIFGIPSEFALGSSTDNPNMPAFFRDSPTTFVEEALKGRNFTFIYSDEHPELPMLEVTYFPLLDDSRVIVGGMAFLKEINQQNKINNIPSFIFNQFQDVLETMNESFAAFNENWEYTYVNKHTSNLFKQPQENLIGQNIWELFPDAKELSIYRNFHKVMEEREPLYFEVYVPAVNKWLENRVYPVTNGIAVFFNDITQRKEQQKAIEKLNEKLEEQNKNLLAQEEELRSQQEDLKQSLSQLEERNFELDQIIYKTSHDLRSPLTSIMGLVNLVKIEKDEAHIRTYILMIENRIAKLDEFVKSMLNFSKANRTPQFAEEIDFNQIIQQSYQDLQFLPGFDRIKKQQTITGGTFHSDSLRLKIIFSNLISNAIKYTNDNEEAPFLKIDIKVSATHADIRIEDNGIGINKEYLPKVFDMFFRGSSKSDGSGLGLYIVKQTIDKLGGALSYESTEGKGTTIRLQLPNMV